MTRWVLHLVLVVLLAQQTGLGSVVVGAECKEPCADDTSPGHCSPVCASCSCARHTSPSALDSPHTAPPEAAQPPASVTVAATPAEPHPLEIRHVPRTSLG